MTSMTKITQIRTQNARVDNAVRFVEKNIVLAILALLLLVLMILRGDGLDALAGYGHFIEWNTIIVLAGVLMITTGIRESHFLSQITRKILSRPISERNVALILVALSALLATFLTNDIALFIIVPLTMSLQDSVENDLTKLVIFEAIAVNVGSALTPIGNPQNLFLWHEWGISFLPFMGKMAPLVALMLLLLLGLAWLSFGRRQLQGETPEDTYLNRRLFALSMVMLAGFIVAAEFHWALYALPVVLLIYLLFYRPIIRDVDWLVLLIFILMFIDFGLVAEFPWVTSILQEISRMGAAGVFVAGALLSQVVSNVPATVMLARFSSDWQAIAYGVNVGGNGLVIASLANLLALRIAGGKGLWLSFHKYSLLFLAVSLALVYLLLR
jgi:Na+/H+ antiporter NhaD/arsenite permease-like protein